MGFVLKMIERGHVPKRPERRPRHKVSMTDEVYERLNDTAKLAGMYFSDVVEALVLRYLDPQEIAALKPPPQEPEQLDPETANGGGQEPPARGTPNTPAPDTKLEDDIWSQL